MYHVLEGNLVPVKPFHGQKVFWLIKIRYPKGNKGSELTDFSSDPL